MRALALLALVCVAPTSARAQCEEGREPTSEGYCCWPGQTWDDERSRCANPPECPEGLVAAGLECVVQGGGATEPQAPTPEVPQDAAAVRDGPSYQGVFSDAPLEAEAETTPSGPVGSEWPSLSTRVPWGELNPRRFTRLNLDWLVPAIAAVVVGYGVSVYSGILTLGSAGSQGGRGFASRTCSDSYGAMAFVPIVGPIVNIVLPLTCEVALYERAGGHLFRTDESDEINDPESRSILAGGALIAQLFGVVALILSVVDPSSVVVFDGEPARLELTGNGVRLTF